jgi:hypothetical protein
MHLINSEPPSLDDLILQLDNPFTSGPGDLIPVVKELYARLQRAERALDEINPGWSYGAHFHCSCASCET